MAGKLSQEEVDAYLNLIGDPEADDFITRDFPENLDEAAKEEALISRSEEPSQFQQLGGPFLGVLGDLFVNPDKGKFIAKKGLQGTALFGRTLGPLQTGQAEEDIQQDFARDLDAKLPTGDQDFITNLIGRGVKATPQISTFPGGAGPAEQFTKTAIGSMLGQAAEEAGFGETTQTILETIPHLSPRLSKLIQARPQDAEFVRYATSIGLNENQIAPLLQEGTRGVDFWGRLAKKGGKTARVIANLNRIKNNAFVVLKRTPEGSMRMSGDAVNKLRRGLSRVRNEVPDSQWQEISKDVDNFMLGKKTLNDATNLWKKINDKFSGQRDFLQLFKGPLSEAIAETSPKFSTLFRQTNDLAERYHFIQGRLAQTNSNWNKIHTIRKAGTAIYGVTTGQPGYVGAVIGELGAGQLAREMLINPRLLNLGDKVATAIIQGGPSAAYRNFQVLRNEIRRTNILDDDALDKLFEIGPDDMEELMKQLNPSKGKE